MSTTTEFNHLKGIALTDRFASLAALTLVVTVLWKAYREFWLPKHDAAEKK